MPTANKSSHFPNRFQQEALKLVSELIDLTSSAFYLLDHDMRHRGVALYNLEPEVEKQYSRTFKLLDPLDPRKFGKTAERVVTLDSQMTFDRLQQTIYYQEFMQPWDHRYVADMFFRHEGNIIAVLSLLRQASLGPFSDTELSLLRKLQPFLEFTLNTVYLPKRVEERQSLEDKYALTKRELDVLELLMAGASNKRVASELGLGVATVKTHLQHIYHKTGVSSRSELLSKIIPDLAQ